MHPPTHTHSQVGLFPAKLSPSATERRENFSIHRRTPICSNPSSSVGLYSHQQRTEAMFFPWRNFSSSSTVRNISVVFLVRIFAGSFFSRLDFPKGALRACQNENSAATHKIAQGALFAAHASATASSHCEGPFCLSGKHMYFTFNPPPP